MVGRLSKIMESSDDWSYLQVHLWRSTARKMTYPLFLCATFYMSGAVCVLGALELVKFRRRAHLILDHLLTGMLGIFHLRNGDILYDYCHHRFMLNIKSG